MHPRQLCFLLAFPQASLSCVAVHRDSLPPCHLPALEGWLTREPTPQKGCMHSTSCTFKRTADFQAAAHIWIHQWQPGHMTKPANSRWDLLGTHKLRMIPAHISFQLSPHKVEVGLLPHVLLAVTPGRFWQVHQEVKHPGTVFCLGC